LAQGIRDPPTRPINEVLSRGPALVRFLLNGKNLVIINIRLTLI